MSFNDYINKIEKISRESRAALKKIKDEHTGLMKQQFHEIFKVFFDSYPEIKEIRWKQFTPYFNDGDTCTFSVHEKYFIAKEYNPNDDLDKYEPFELYEKPSNWVINMAHKYPDYKKTVDLWDENCQNPRFVEIAEAVANFKAFLDSVEEDIYYDIFGDHIEIVASSSGFDVEDYDHD